MRFSINGVKGLSIYEYDEGIKDLLYQFKGCFDIELAPVFLYQFIKELRFMYKGYVIIPAPSYRLDDERRGFNHVEEIFKQLNLQIFKLVYKIAPFKQAEQSSKMRSHISRYLVSQNMEKIRGKKVLIVDDVATTGSTMISMINLIRKGEPQDIKILVMSKRLLNEY